MIKEVNNNQFISKDGENRYLFNLFPKDLEQREANEVLKEIDLLKRGLGNIKTEDVIKIYNIDGKYMIESKSAQNPIPYFDSGPFLEGLAPFIKGKNVFSNPLFKDDYCKLNGKFLRFISVKLDEEHSIDIDGLAKYGNYFISIQRMKTVFSKMMVGDARRMSHTSLYSALSDIEGIETFKENEVMLKKIITKEEELFRTEIIFVITSDIEIDFQEQTDNLLAELELGGLSPVIETTALNSIFKNYIPGFKPIFQKPLLFHSSLLVNCLPTHQDKIMDKGVVFHSRSWSELFLDLRQGHNYSSCVTGNSGSGKTVFVNKMIDHDLNIGRKTLVIDPKFDYRKHALLKNAYIVDNSINPMIFKDAKYLKDIIISKIPKEERTSLWTGKLLKAIRETEAYNCDHFFKALELIAAKGFPDLEYYFEDIRENISQRKMNISDFTYIEFESFSNDSIPFILSFAFEYVKRFNSPYNLIIDEAHRVFKHDPDFLEERVREMRAKNSSLITITQNYKDLVSNHFGEIVADNSFHKFFFSQNINEGMGIDAFDLENINSLRTLKGEYSEYYYKSELHRKVMRYRPTLRELEVFGSEEKQTQSMLLHIKKNLEFFTVDECINQWVRDKYAI